MRLWGWASVLLDCVLEDFDCLVYQYWRLHGLHGLHGVVMNAKWIVVEMLKVEMLNTCKERADGERGKARLGLPRFAKLFSLAINAGAAHTLQAN